MLEIKVTLEAPELSASINNLAGALAGKAEPAEKAEALKPATVTLPSFIPAGDGPVYTDTPIPPRTTVPVAAPVQSRTEVKTEVPVQNVPIVPVVPTGAPQYTLDMISIAGRDLVDKGMLDKLYALLDKYGVDSLTRLQPSQYGAIAADLRALGANI